jgi:hypothetical protein
MRWIFLYKKDEPELVNFVDICVLFQLIRGNIKCKKFWWWNLCTYNWTWIW